MLALLDLPPECAPVASALDAALARVAARFDEHLATDLDAVDDLLAHLTAYRGKMLRPSLCLLMAMACAEDPADLTVRDEHITCAAVVEMVHMATLVHDDVLDEADLRRRSPTINHLRGNEAAVILGDYLIASAYALCSTITDQATSLAVARASRTVCAGELLQLSNRGNLDLDEQTYFQIIDRKTGELAALACRLGAMHAGATPARIDAADRFGRLLGQAFQIQDDLLDLTASPDTVGKSTQRDLDLGKLTLPLIRHLAACDRPGLARAHIRDHDTEALTRELAAGGAIEEAREKAGTLIRQALAYLDTLQPSAPRIALQEVARAAIRRDH